MKKVRDALKFIVQKEGVICLTLILILNGLAAKFIPNDEIFLRYLAGISISIYFLFIAYLMNRETNFSFRTYLKLLSEHKEIIIFFMLSLIGALLLPTTILKVNAVILLASIFITYYKRVRFVKDANLTMNKILDFTSKYPKLHLKTVKTLKNILTTGLALKLNFTSRYREVGKLEKDIITLFSILFLILSLYLIMTTSINVFIGSIVIMGLYLLFTFILIKRMIDKNSTIIIYS